MGSGNAFKIGPIVVHWYGLLIVVGTLLGGWVATREAKRRGEDAAHVWSGLVWCLPLGFLGARLYHLFTTPADGSGGFHYYTENPLAIMLVWSGGLGIYGAIAGGVLGARLYTWRHRLNLWRWLDVGAPGLALAQALVRWANWINQELYGPPTRLPWGLFIGESHRLPRYSDLALYPTSTTRFHPTFLYDSLWHLGIFCLLIGSRRRWNGRLRDGDVFLVYLGLFGLGRVWIVQFFRPDAWRLANGLAVEALIGAGLASVASLAWWVRHRLQPG